MAEGINVFSRGTAATVERPKSNYRPFLNDVRSGNLSSLPDRLKDVVHRMQDAGGKAGAGAKINDVLATFAGTGNQFVMNTASRMAEAAEAGVFNHPDAHKIMKELMLECPQAADSVPKMLADLRHDLGDRFYGLSAGHITRIAGRSMRASASHCPREIHRKMAELTIRGEFDHIPQMHALRMEKATAHGQAVAINGFATFTVAAQMPGQHAESRPVQAFSDHSTASLAETLPLKPMEFRAPQQPNRLRNAPLAESVIVRETIQRAPRVAAQLAREHVLRGREEQRALARSAEPQARILKQVGPEARQQAQKASTVTINAQPRMENKEPKRLKFRQRIRMLQVAAKPAAVKKLREKLRVPINRVRELARAAKRKIAEKRAEAKKRRESKPAIAKRIPKEKRVQAAAIAKKKKAGTLLLPLRMKRGKWRTAEAGKRTSLQARGPATLRRMPRLRRGRSRPGFLRFLIAPGFFSFRRQRKNSAVRARNHF